jgi:hypothetical protein
MWSLVKFVLTRCDGYVVFGLYPTRGRLWCPDIDASSIDLAQLSRFNLKKKTKTVLRKVMNNE